MEFMCTKFVVFKQFVFFLIEVPLIKKYTRIDTLPEWSKLISIVKLEGMQKIGMKIVKRIENFYIPQHTNLCYKVYYTFPFMCGNFPV